MTTTPDAFSELSKLVSDNVQITGLDQRYDLLKLMGIVLGQITLLQIATGSSDEKARVSAAKALITIKESPEGIAERLRRSPFAALTVKQLESIVRAAGEGEADLRLLIEQSQHGGGSPNATPSHEPSG